MFLLNLFMASLNASPKYYAAEKRYSEATSPEEKLEALEEMLRECPKHKGAQDLMMEIKSKISRLRKEVEKERIKKKQRGGREPSIRKVFPQVLLLGFANSGKTALFNAITGLCEKSSSIPFETRDVVPGMMFYEKVGVQVLDTPSITEENKARLFGFARNADLTLILLNDFSEKSFFESLNAKKEFLEKKMVFELPNEELKRFVYFSLSIIRVFTKDPKTGEIDFEKPMVLSKGSTVKDVGKDINSSLAKTAKYARVWGSTKFPGQQVNLNYELKDGDVVELH